MVKFRLLPADQCAAIVGHKNAVGGERTCHRLAIPVIYGATWYQAQRRLSGPHRITLLILWSVVSGRHSDDIGGDDNSRGARYAETD